MAKETQLDAYEAQLNPSVNIDGWLQQRDEFIKKVSTKMVEGKDFHVIQNKKSLAKGGAEKIASIFGWQASFTKDSETLEMLNGETKDTIAYVCRLLKGDEFIGEGRGARNLSKDAGDVNKSIKMAQKSAYIDAIIRASGLSDIFTQDLEDMNLADISRPAPKTPQNGSTGRIREPNVKATEPQKGKVMALCRQCVNHGLNVEEILGITGKVDIETLTKGQASTIIDKLDKAIKDVGAFDKSYDGKELKCEDCGNNITAGVKSWSQKTFGKVYCMNCQAKHKDEFPGDSDKTLDEAVDTLPV